MYNLDGMLTRIPPELRQLKQWAIDAGIENATETDRQGKRPMVWSGEYLFNAATTKPEHWMQFAAAANMAQLYKRNVGFLLTKEDPYIVVDLDIVDEASQRAKGQNIDPSKWTTREEYEVFWRIAQSLNSYTEKSRSGKGLHIFVRGHLPQQGLRKGNIEMYSAERFIICTGDVIINEPIKHNQQTIEFILADMQWTGDSQREPLVEIEATESDETVWERAIAAENAEKFVALCRGQWEAYNYPSRSEADMSLISMFCYYTQSNEQVRRMFRQTVLGSRDKHQKRNYHIDRCIRSTRSKEHNDVVIDTDAMLRSLEVRRAISMEEEAKAHKLREATLNPPPLTVPNVVQAPAVAPDAAMQMVSLAPIDPIIANATEPGTPWPPGGAGAIAQFIYRSAPRPIKEVAIVATLGLLAGMFGRTFHINNSGLNLYMILVAPSGVGKEALHSGIGALCKHIPDMEDHVEFRKMASGPALIKTILQKRCFVNVVGEWGHMLARLALQENQDGPLASLRHEMTNIYQKSGPNSYVGGMAYSNQENDTDSGHSVAYSMIGESTPKKFYQSLTESMMEDGFMSRFTVLEYNGLRPELNQYPLIEPDGPLKDGLQLALNRVNLLVASGESVPVGRTEEASSLFRSFEKECDANVNGTTDESRRQMWSRASLKCMRISALLAVIDNSNGPIIDAGHVHWALHVVRDDIDRMRRRLDGGDIGMDDQARELRILSIIREYFAAPPPPSMSIPDGIYQEGIIPLRYLTRKAQTAASFNQHKNGTNAALSATIASMVSKGYLVEVEKVKLAKDFSFHGKAYRCVNMPSA